MAYSVGIVKKKRKVEISDLVQFSHTDLKTETEDNDFPKVLLTHWHNRIPVLLLSLSVFMFIPQSFLYGVPYILLRGCSRR